MSIEASVGYVLQAVNIELTLACNMNCVHCGAGVTGRARDQELELDHLSRALREIKALGAGEVCFLGGEPFLRRDWYEVARSARDAGLDVVFISNGWPITDRLVSRLRELSVRRIGVSLDGPQDVHDAIRRRSGSFTRALSALHRLRDAGLEVGAITTVSRRNVDRLVEIRDLLLDERISWQLQVASLHGERFPRSEMLTRGEFYRLAGFIAATRAEYGVERMPIAGSHDIGYHSSRLCGYSEAVGDQWYGCGAGIFFLGLTSDGGVKGCLSMAAGREEGNILQRSLTEIWNDPRLFSRNRHFSTDLLQGSCRGCPHGVTCRAGCADLAESATGNTYHNPYCLYRIEQDGATEEQ